MSNDDLIREAREAARLAYDTPFQPNAALLNRLAAALEAQPAPYRVDVALGFALRTLTDEQGVEFLRVWNEHIAVQPAPLDRDALIAWFHDRFTDSGLCVHDPGFVLCHHWSDAILARFVQSAPLVADSEEALVARIHAAHASRWCISFTGDECPEAKQIARALVEDGTVRVVAPGVIDRDSAIRAVITADIDWEGNDTGTWDRGASVIDAILASGLVQNRADMEQEAVASYQRMFTRHDVSNQKHYDEAVEERIVAERERDAAREEAAALRDVILAALDRLRRNDDPLTSRAMTVDMILASVPSDVLRERDAEKWDEGAYAVLGAIDRIEGMPNNPYRQGVDRG